MEFPESAVTQERVLAAVAILLSLGAAALERNSAVASAVREGAPYNFEVSFAGSSQRFDARLQPGKRRLWLVEGSPAQGPRVIVPHALDAGEAPLAAKRALLPRRAGQWVDFLEARGEMPAADRFFLAVELSRMSAGDVRAARMPTDDADRLLLVSAIEAPSAPDDAMPTAEVFNASGVRGLAGAATRRLRERGADVLTSGNAAQINARTVIYDRVGRPEKADRIARLLGCPLAEVQTQPDRKRLVDATVELGEDCADALGKTLAVEPEKS